MENEKAVELVAAYRKGDKQAERDLVEEYRGLVRSIARRYNGRGLPGEDLVQVAWLAFTKALTRFDPQQGLLRPYLITTLHGELKRHFRDKGWDVTAPRGMKELATTAIKEMKEWQKRNGSDIPLTELAERIGVTERKAQRVLTLILSFNALSMDVRPGDDSSQSALNVGNDDMDLKAVPDRLSLHQALQLLSPEDRRLLFLRFVVGLPQSEVAKRLNLSQPQVSRRERKARAYVQEQLRET